MWFSLFATVLILAITFYEGLHGLFTGLINCILAILSAALAFGLYEDVYFAFLKDHQAPEYGLPIALMSIFIITLLVLRTLFDILVKDNMQFPVYLDRAGGGLFGFINGMVIVGMLSIGFQMLPFGDTILGFARMELVDKATNKPLTTEELGTKDPAEVQYIRNHTWLRQDEFTVALVSHVSANALAGRNKLSHVYPDFLGQAYRLQARLGKEGRPSADPKLGLKVEGYWNVGPTDFYSRKLGDKDGKKVVSLELSKEQPEPGFKRLTVRVAFQDAGKLEFTPEQVRLVAVNANTGRASEHVLAGISDDKAGNRLVGTWDGETLVRELGGKNNRVDFVFEVPQDVAFDEGSFVEFKQIARAEITPAKGLDKKPAGGLDAPTGRGSSGRPRGGSGDDAGSTEGSGGAGRGSNRRPRGVSDSSSEDNPTQGRVSSIGPARGALVSDALPLTLTNYGGNGEISGSAIRGGRVVASLDANWGAISGDRPPLERIHVQPDMRLIQVSVEKLQPRSIPGQAMGFARDKVANFWLEDARGGKHPPVGMYAMAMAGGQRTFEMVLLDETARSGEDTFAKLPFFEKITRLDLKNEYALYYIFQVKPGTRAVRIHTGGQPVDLGQLNLVAE